MLEESCLFYSFIMSGRIQTVPSHTQARWLELTVTALVRGFWVGKAAVLCWPTEPWRAHGPFYATTAPTFACWNVHGNIILMSALQQNHKMLQSQLTRNTQLMMSEAILAWGVSSSFVVGVRLWSRHTSRSLTRADACLSTLSVSLYRQKPTINTGLPSARQSCKADEVKWAVSAVEKIWG